MNEGKKNLLRHKPVSIESESDVDQTKDLLDIIQKDEYYEEDPVLEIKHQVEGYNDNFGDINNINIFEEDEDEEDETQDSNYEYGEKEVEKDLEDILNKDEAIIVDEVDKVEKARAERVRPRRRPRPLDRDVLLEGSLDRPLEDQLKKDQPKGKESKSKEGQPELDDKSIDSPIERKRREILEKDVKKYDLPDDYEKNSSSQSTNNNSLMQKIYLGFKIDLINKAKESVKEFHGLTGNELNQLWDEILEKVKEV